MTKRKPGVGDIKIADRNKSTKLTVGELIDGLMLFSNYKKVLGAELENKEEYTKYVNRMTTPVFLGIELNTGYEEFSIIGLEYSVSNSLEIVTGYRPIFLAVLLKKLSDLIDAMKIDRDTEIKINDKQYAVDFGYSDNIVVIV